MIASSGKDEFFQYILENFTIDKDGRNLNTMFPIF